MTVITLLLGAHAVISADEFRSGAVESEYEYKEVQLRLPAKRRDIERKEIDVSGGDGEWALSG